MEASRGIFFPIFIIQSSFKIGKKFLSSVASWVGTKRKLLLLVRRNSPIAAKISSIKSNFGRLFSLFGLSEKENVKSEEIFSSDFFDRF